MDAITLETSVSQLPYVGPIYAKKLERLGVLTINDLFYHLPFRYDNFTLMSSIQQLQVGETVSIIGLVESIKNIYTKNGKRLTEAKISDDTDSISIIWFNQPYLTRVIQSGLKYIFSGKVDWFGRKKSLISPQYELWEKGEHLHTGRLVPIYPETAGITSKWLRNRIGFLLKSYLNLMEDLLPAEIIKEYQFEGVREALSEIHFPRSLETAEKARERLAFEELFYLQLTSAFRKKTWQEETVGHIFKISQYKEKIVNFMNNLPFVLTNSQKRAVSEILGDLAYKYPMNRLLEGDVASGKTVVATIGMYLSFLNGFQSALMAPTEILAEQHYQTVSSLLTPLGVKVKLLTSSIKKDQKLITNNQKPDILIGTHSLLHENSEFKNLGLVVIDEQQRFGVEQRETLQKKGINPHLLTMTATPIPRTIALTLYGELDLSILDEMPQGRQKIKTWVVPEEKREDSYRWLEKNLKQAFIICPLIEDSETLQTVKAATSEYVKIKQIFNKYQVALLHGRLKSEEKKNILKDFREGKIAILVATPVVEVGIDIPNANIMVIEAADRFGLSQLHQLRGRVGRNNQEAYCFLFSQSNLPQTILRLKSLETHYSGPELAEIDLKLRGPGEITGTRQHGVLTLKAARFTDYDLLEKARLNAQKLLAKDDLIKYPKLKEVLKKRLPSITITN
ncbi:ATP-dependent DNA helicase RecG [Candidatus Gottesmanbacteria bacterium]|nr:ATP-dependent DNA helicase RecG [Candidatus Gottesmanbacteria bacterium]